MTSNQNDTQPGAAAERADRIVIAYNMLTDGAAFEVKLVGRKDPASLSPHAMAQEFPLADRLLFRDTLVDVERNGFRDPIDLTADDQIVDGRTRVAVGWVTGIPVPVRQLDDDSKAESIALSGNLYRRHLSAVAHAAIFDKFVVPALAREAAEREKGGVEVPESLRGRTIDKASEMSGGRFSPATLQRVKGLSETAPKTYRRVVEGELTSVPQIKEEAQAEQLKRARGPKREALQADLDTEAAKAEQRKLKARERATSADKMMVQLQETTTLWVAAMREGRYGESTREEQQNLAAALAEEILEFTPVAVDPTKIQADIASMTERLSTLIKPATPSDD